MKHVPYYSCKFAVTSVCVYLSLRHALAGEELLELCSLGKGLLSREMAHWCAGQARGAHRDWHSNPAGSSQALSEVRHKGLEIKPKKVRKKKIRKNKAVIANGPGPRR